MKPKMIKLKQPYNAPNMSNMDIPDNYEMIEDLFVDKSGMGAPGEPALTVPQFERKVQELLDERKDRLYWAITNEGQFQLYVGIFIKN